MNDWDDRFDRLWKYQGKKQRAVKYLLTPSKANNDKLAAFREVFRKAVQYMIHKLHSTNTRLTKATKDKDLWESEAETLSVDMRLGDLARLKRSVTNQATRILRSYEKRNGGPSENEPHYHNSRSVPLPDGVVRDLNKGPSCAEGYLRLQIHGNEFQTIPYFIPSGMMRYKQYLNHSSFGGVLTTKGGRLMWVARATIPVSWLYEPDVYIGIDINAHSPDFATLSNSIKYPHSPKLESAIARLKVLNEELRISKKKGPGRLSTRKREGIRKKVEIVKARIFKQVKPIGDAIIAEVVNSKALLCIDSVTTGQKNGSFGQEHLIEYLTKTCEDRGIPHVVVPSYWTSQACSNCKQLGKRDKALFTCPHCHFDAESDSQINGAKNVGWIGWFIWMMGLGAHQLLIGQYRLEAAARDAAEPPKPKKKRKNARSGPSSRTKAKSGA